MQTFLEKLTNQLLSLHCRFGLDHSTAFWVAFLAFRCVFCLLHVIMILSSCFTSDFSSDMYIFFYPVTPQPPYHHIIQKQSIFIFYYYFISFHILQPIFRAVLWVKSFFFSQRKSRVRVVNWMYACYVHNRQTERYLFFF